MIESEYLKQTILAPLLEGIAEVVVYRPEDPVEYLAQWLMKYRENQIYIKQAVADGLVLQLLRDEKNEKLKREEALEAEQRLLEEKEKEKKEQEEKSALALAAAAFARQQKKASSTTSWGNSGNVMSTLKEDEGNTEDRKPGASTSSSSRYLTIPKQ